MHSRQSIWIGALLCVVGQTGSSSLLGQQPVPGAAPAKAPTLITSLPGQELFPSVAPDGTVAYSRVDGPDWDVFVQRRGASPVNLTADSPTNDWQAEF